MLTMVVPTKNRSGFLMRMLRYYNDQRLACRMVVADSSDRAHVERARRTIEGLKPGLNVDYRLYPPDIEIFDKMRDAVDCVETPYAVVGSDDDFFVSAALQRSVAFLEAHPDYSIAHGGAALFTLREGTAYGPIAGVHAYRQRNIEHPTAVERLRDHLYQYAATWYSVQRAEQSRNNFRKSAQLQADTFFIELVPSSLSIIQGKARKLDGLYMVRQVHPDRESARAGGRMDVFDWVADPNWSGQYQRFRDCLAEELARQDGISLRDAREVVKEAFWSYLAQGLTKKWQGRYALDGCGSPSKWRKLARRIPGARRAWRELRSMIPTGRDEISLLALLRPSSPYQADFMPVYRAVTTSPPDPIRSITEGEDLVSGSRFREKGADTLG